MLISQIRKLPQVALAFLLIVGVSGGALAQPLTEAQARTIIAPWYSLFNVASRGDVKAVQEQILTADYESCAGYLPGECWGRDTSIKVVGGFAKSIPDMTFEMCIRDSRKLEDDGRQAQLIKTVRGGGYVLAAEVERE